MAKVSNQDYSLRGGKLSKKSPLVNRVRNGRQQSYMLSDNDKEPSAAQKAYRKFFGKITSTVNAIMADPQQSAAWEQRRIDYHHSIAQDMRAPRYKTLRQFVHAVISAQIEQNEAAKRRKKPIQKALPKGLKLHIKTFPELSTTELYEIIKARFNVFYLEQHIIYPDLDDIDYLATHIAIFRKGHVIAYSRLFPDNVPGQYILGRVLTIERSKGFGKYIILQAEQQALSVGAQTLALHAQIQTVPFYESLGYTTVGDIFEEAGIPHVLMKKSLN